MSTQTIIFIGVVIYLLLMLVVGIYSSKKSNTADDFIVSGRSMPLWLCSVTLMATWFGAGPMVGAAGTAYEEGLLGVIADPFGGALVMILCGLFFVRLFRRLKLLTYIELLTSRYGKIATTIASLGSISSNIGWTAAMLVAFGSVFESLTGIPLEVGIISGAVVVLIYTSAGGMWAVAITDFVQMAIIAVGLIMLLTVVLIDVGGWSVISAQLPEHTFRMIPLEHTAEKWMMYFRMWLIFGLADLTSQSLIQRAMSAKTEQVAQNSFYVAGVGYLAFGMIPVMLGIIASVTMPGLADPEKVIPLLAIDHLHPIAIAIFVGALMSAIMSTTDSALLAAASVFSTNVLPLFKKQASDRLRLLATRIAIPVFGIFSVVVAIKIQVVYNLILDSNSVILVCVTVPFIAGVWWKKANRSGAVAGMVVGFTVWMFAYFYEPQYPADFLGMLACLVTMLVVTPLTQKIDPPQPVRNNLGEPVELTDRLGILPLFRRVPDTAD